MDADLQRAIEESKRLAASETNADAALRRALSLSRHEEEARQEEITRQREAELQAARRRQQQPQRTGGGGGRISEEEQLRLVLEQSRIEEEKRKAREASGDRALQMAIEASKKTKAEEDERRKQEERELNFALQLSAALYQASRVRKKPESKGVVLQGTIQKNYIVPVAEGELELTLKCAKDIPDLKSGSYRQQPYAVLRIMSIAPVGTLQLTIHKGTNLRNTQMLGAQDPYTIVVMDGRRKATTKVHYDAGRNPQWEESFSVEMTGKEKSSAIELQIWNKNMVSDESIGFAYIDIADLLTPTEKRWLRVNRKKGKKRWNNLDGQVCVSWKFMATGAPGFKQLKVIESKTAYSGGVNPKWDQVINVKDMWSNSYVQATLRNKKTFGTDTILAMSSVISVQGSIHQNFLSGAQNDWHPLAPSQAAQDKCPRGDAGRLQIGIKFKTAEYPDGLQPVESDDIPETKGVPNLGGSVAEGVIEPGGVGVHHGAVQGQIHGHVVPTVDVNVGAPVVEAKIVSGSIVQ